MPNTQDIYVRSDGSANVTNTIRGERASATMSHAMAAQRLAEKLFGPSLIRVTEVNEGNHIVTRWCAEADDEVWASCDDMGQIVVSPVIPVRNTGLARGPHRALVYVMQELGARIEGAELAEPATHAQGRTVLLRLVPGVTEATSRQAKDEAIHRWLQQQSKRNGKKGSLSCWFCSTVVRCAL